MALMSLVILMSFVLYFKSGFCKLVSACPLRYAGNIGQLHERKQWESRRESWNISFLPFCKFIIKNNLPVSSRLAERLQCGRSNPALHYRQWRIPGVQGSITDGGTRSQTI